jgi:hypothetical protein
LTIRRKRKGKRKEEKKRKGERNARDGAIRISGVKFQKVCEFSANFGEA